MSNIEKLKQELLLQKQTIENLGGEVLVANNHPSPAEITQGISTIEVPDLTGSTATEEDVLYGKTFFSKDDTLRVGTHNDVGTTIKHVYEYQVDVISTDVVLNYDFPSTITTIKPYAYYHNKNQVNFNFHENVDTIGAYAFAEASNFTFNNFNSLTKLTTIPEGCFSGCNLGSEILENLPIGLRYIIQNSFQNTLKENANIIIPANVETIGSYAFTSSAKVYCNTLEFSLHSRANGFGTSVFENIVFNCDFNIPENITNLSYKFAYNGSFNNVVMSKNISALYQYCLGAASTTPISDVRLKTITFTRTNPPSTFYENCFPSQAKENGLKIYVPDASIESYKSKLTAYADYIYPVSQKD